MDRIRRTRLARALRSGTPLAFVLPAFPIAFAALALAPHNAQASFHAAKNYTTGSQPYSVAAGDLNGDGKPDVVTANYGSAGGNTVSVLLNSGTGTFPTHTDVATGGVGAISVAIGDLNGDGKLDLAVASLSSNNVSVLIGGGGGSFAAPVVYATGTAPFWVALADLNGDGKLDMVDADDGSNLVSVRLGDGTGSFAARTTYATGSTPVYVAIRDLNGDGKADLVVSNYNANSVSVLLGAGDGSFGPRTDVAVGTGPYGIAIADFNGDGKLDLAVANGNASTISILPGDGSGGFGGRTDIPAGGGPATIAAQDLDADGNVDLAVGNDTGGSVSVFPGNGSGGFGARTDYVTGSYAKGVAIADVNGDVKPDLVVSNEGPNTVSVLTNGAGLPTSTSLSSSPNPSLVGDPVTLTAVVTPGAATGIVEFLDSGTLIGTAPLSGGTASLTNSGLAAGPHTLTATYDGDATYDLSTSPAVVQTVNRGASAVALASSSNPSVFTQPVKFTATVTGSIPGGPVPTGVVQFKVDGVDVGGAKNLVGGTATSDDVTTLSIGTHVAAAVYNGDGNYLSSTSPNLTQTITAPNPAIVAVRDVPNDQGGHVFITWRSPLDKPGVKVVTGYRVWRRAPNPAAASAEAATAGPAAAGLRHVTGPGGVTETFWEAIATLPAEQLVSYAYEAPTTQDSIAGSNPYTAFFVTALTADPFQFFESEVDSGYSVDNLSPPTPAPFAATYGPGSVTLHWVTSPVSDFREFRLYRGASPTFVPGPSNLVTATRDTTFTDVTTTAYAYKLAAVDLHGNTSRYALVTVEGPVATLISLVAVDAGPERIRITWCSPGNPGIAATLYRRAAGTDWVAAASLVADGSGYLTYEDDAVVTGARYGYRLGVQDGGIEVLMGEVWAVADRLVLSLEGPRPNPAASNHLVVAFSLPSAAPARLDLLDVAGRRVVAREVGGLGPGAHTVTFDARIRPGMYLLRLAQGTGTLTRRVIVLN